MRTTAAVAANDATGRPEQHDRLTAQSVIVCFGVIVGNAVSSTAVLNGTFGAFLAPVSVSLGWTRTAFSGVLLVLAVVGLASYGFFGRVADRHGARPTLIVGNILFAASVAGLSMISPSSVRTYSLFILAGLTGSIPSTVIMAKVIAEWFAKWRGIVFAMTATVGISIGYVLLPSFTEWAIEAYGWRSAYLILGTLVIVAGQLAFWLTIPSPATKPTFILHDSARKGLTAAQARRLPAFWMTSISVCLASCAFTGFLTHVVAMATDRGVAARVAVLTIPALAIVNVLWQIVMGWVFARRPTPRIAGPTLLAAIAGMIVLAQGRTAMDFVLGGALLGIGSGADYSLLPYALQRYFGLKAYGEIYGSAFGANLFFASAGPLLLGLCRDWGGSYWTGVWVFSVMYVAAAVIILCLPPYARVTVEPDPQQ